MDANTQVAGRVVTRQEIEVRANKLMRAWREPCFVYQRRGYWVMSRGPDFDHPKTDPLFVVRYEKEVKHERL